MSERDAFLELVSAFESAVVDNEKGYSSPEWLTKELTRAWGDVADAFDRVTKERDEARSELNALRIHF